MIHSESYGVLFGAIVGFASAIIVSIVNGVVTFRSSKETLKFELKKLYLPLLKDRLIMLETIKVKYSIDYSQELNADSVIHISEDYNFLAKTFIDFAHYFIESDLYPVLKKIHNNIILESEQDIKNEQNDIMTSYNKMEFNYKMNELLTESLINLENEIKVMCNNHK